MGKIRISLRVLNIAFILISVFLIVLGGETYLRIRRISSTTDMLYKHSEKRNLILQSFYTFKDIETSTRGFILLGDSLLLENRKNDLERHPQIMNQLKEGVKNNPLQFYFFNELNGLYNGRLFELQNAIKSNDPRFRKGVLDNSAEVVDHLREHIETMLEAEDKDLTSVSSDLKKHLNITPFALLALFVFFIISLLLSYLFLNRQLQLSKKLQINLEESNISLEKHLTLLNERNEELKSANDQLKHFTFIVSHDLQEPLRKIQTFSNKLLDKLRIDQSLKEDADKIRDSASKMSDLLLAITRYSRLQIGLPSVQLVDLNHISQKVINDLEIQIRQKHASVVIDTLPTISCDPQQISQLFMHLIMNSIKFSSRPPVIRISCELVDDALVLQSLKPGFSYYRIRFADNGIGFDSQYSEKVFVIFQRLHNTTTFQGTGVGLALCQKIVENHKGKISAYSKEEEGSTFDVYLPANLTLN